MAQQLPPAAATAPAVAGPPKNLFEALPNFRWDPAQNGPLIIVVPQAATPTRPPKKPGEKEAPPLPPFPSMISGVYRTNELLDYYGRRIVRLRGVTVFAPAQMIVLNTNLGKPDLYAKMSMTDKMQILEASLTPSQWQSISSPNGLGMGDLQGEQRDIFNALLPNPFVYRVTTMPSPGELSRALNGEALTKREPPVKKTVTDAQRSSIRLRINRETTLFSPSVDPSSPFNIGIVQKEDPGTSLLVVDEQITRDRSESFGAVLSQAVPSYLKKGQIDFDAAALNVPVTFADATTVGELIQRIRTATRTEIYADLRLARLPITIRAVPDAQLRAGELLKALCWSVTGAVRYVRREGGDSAASGVFILTDDVEGLGIRWDRITDWTMAASSAEYDAKHRRDRVIRRKKVLDTIGFAPDETFTPTPEQKAQIEKGWSNGVSRFLGVSYPISVLPPDLQERARQSAQETNAVRAKDTSGRPPKLVSSEMVSVSVRLGMRLDVPDVGSIPVGLWSSGGLDSFLPDADYTDPLRAAQPVAKTITLAPTLKAGGVLSVTPTNEEEARVAVRAARTHGLRQVWIAALPEREDTSREQADTEFQRILAAAVGEARQASEKPVDVLAVARVLSVPTRHGGDKAAVKLSPMDINLNGQSESRAAQSRLDTALFMGQDTRSLEKATKQARDWLLPDEPVVIRRVAARLSALAATPGLSGIVLTDLVAPGYRIPKVGSRYYDGDYTNLGYTANRRIAAIQAFGVDPVDIELSRGYVSPDAPGPYLIEGTAQRIAVKIANEKKPPVDPTKTEDLAALAETDPVIAWNALRFRATADLLDSVYAKLTEAAKSRTTPFTVYMENMGSGYSGWFSTWEKRDKLPVTLDFQDDERRSERDARSARAASSCILFRHSYVPSEDPDDPNSTTDAPPLPPAEKFALDFNRMLSRSKSVWDGYVFDLRDLPLSKALEILQSVTPAAKAARK